MIIATGIRCHSLMMKRDHGQPNQISYVALTNWGLLDQAIPACTPIVLCNYYVCVCVCVCVCVYVSASVCVIIVLINLQTY